MLNLSLTASSQAADAAKGKSDFKKCKACRSIIGAKGAGIVKGGKTGPNIFGFVGRPAASYPDFEYGDGILAANAVGAIWDEGSLAAYVADPTASLQQVAGDPAAKSRMT